MALLLAACPGDDQGATPQDTSGASSSTTTGGVDVSSSDMSSSGVVETTTTGGMIEPCRDEPVILDQVATVDVERGTRCVLTFSLSEPRLVEVSRTSSSIGIAIELDGTQSDRPGWSAPRMLDAGEHTVLLDNSTTVTVTAEVLVHDFGPPLPEVIREHSLVWTQPELTEDPSTCGLACVMEAIVPDGGGLMLQNWFEAFATTDHSQRFGPPDMLDAYAMALGPDPQDWDLDALPFVVTAIHNRIDLAGDGHCGELRISMASVDPQFRPFHLIFLFRQHAGPHDVSPDGAVTHCTATARRWAELSTLSEGDMVEEVRAVVGGLKPNNGFIAAETVEFITSPWEWRQWFPTEASSFELWNERLFQTVDTARLNQAGVDRDEFLAFVEEYAELLDARAFRLPTSFRPMSMRVNQGVPWVPLDLDGANGLEKYPQLRQNIEITGCPGCHTADAEFVHTLPDRTFSPFYDAELDARAARLDASARGEITSPAPFGPLQDDPILPP